MEKFTGDKKYSAGKLISELSRAAHIYFHNEFKKYNIGHAQIRTLLYIAHNENFTQKELVNILNLDKSSITSQIQILEKNGYIIREISDKDARIQIIRISDKTRKILPSLLSVFESWTDTILDGFDAEERIEIFKYLEKMKTNAKNKLSTLNK